MDREGTRKGEKQNWPIGVDLGGWELGVDGSGWTRRTATCDNRREWTRAGRKSGMGGSGLDLGGRELGWTDWGTLEGEKRVGRVRVGPGWEDNGGRI